MEKDNNQYAKIVYTIEYTDDNREWYPIHAVDFENINDAIVTAKGATISNKHYGFRVIRNKMDILQIYYKSKNL